jgi:hypothetical protein
MKKFTLIQLTEQSVAYMEMYPAKDKIYATDDGNFFLDKNPAQNHANKTGSSLYTFEREKAPVTSQAQDPSGELEAMKERLKATDVDKMEYNDAKAMLGALSLVAESGKKADVLLSLSNYKAEISQ